MSINTIDQLDITKFTNAVKETKAPKKVPVFEASFGAEETISNNKAAILQVNIAEKGTGAAELTAALKLLDKKFTSVTIFIDMQLALLIYSIIMPYMSKEQLQDIIGRRKKDWTQQNILTINQLTIPWLIVTDNEQRIEKDKNNNILKLKNLLRSDTSFRKHIQTDAAALKTYLTETKNITSAVYQQAQAKNDTAIENYLITKIAAIEAMHAFNNYKHTYITTHTICSYNYLRNEADMQDLPPHLILELTIIAQGEEPEILTSTNLNQKLHELGLLSKISERKSYLEQSIKNFPGNVYLQSLNQTLIGCNKSQSLTFGIENDSYLVDKDFKRLFSKDEADKISNTANEIATKNTAKIFIESNYYPLAGKEIYFLTIKTPIRNKTNKITGILGFSQKLGDKKDVAKFKNSEPDNIMQSIIEEDKKSKKKHTIPDPVNLKKIIAYMPGNVFWQDIDGQMLGCNNDHAKFLGFDKPEDLIGKYPSDFLTTEYAKDANEAIKEMAKTGEPVITEEVYKAANGFTVMNSHKTPIKDNDGKVIGIIVVSFDISERRQGEIQLEQEKDKLEKDNSLKNKLVQDIEHDMRTPFVGLYSMTELCLHQETDVEKKKQLSQISSYAKELLTHCDSLLEFNKNGSFSNNTNSISIKELINRVVSTNIMAIKAKHLEFKLDYDESIPEKVMCDPYRVKKILNHLISNASHRTQAGYVKLAVRLESGTENIATISFTISDSGAEISKKEQQHILGKNVNTEEEFSLNDVKRFVEDLRGTITIASGKETSARVKLNFIVPEAAPQEEPILQEVISKKILIVEDSRITIKFLEGITTELGCTSKTATTGEDALHLIANEHFDVLLLDIDLEDTDGYTLAQEIRMLELKQQQQPIKIIMMTAQQSKLHQNRNAELNIADFFVKPIKINKLIATMQNITKSEPI